MPAIPITPTGAWNYNESMYNESRFLDTEAADYIANLIGSDCTLLDFGCGTGDYLKYMQDKLVGLETVGVEPYIQNHTDLKIPNVSYNDLTAAFELGKKGHVMCIEVLAHIPAELEQQAIDNIVSHCDGYLIVSWAKYGQPGHGHVNCKDQAEVVALFEARGFTFLEKNSFEVRSSSRLPWLQKNLCIFKRKPPEIKELSVVVITNYIPSHPSIAIIQQMLESLYLLQISRDTEIIISFDALKPAIQDDPECINKYDQYFNNLRNYLDTEYKFKNVRLVKRPTWGGILGNTRHGIQFVKTKYMMVCQHDLYFKIPVTVYPLINLMEKYSEVKHLRFNTLQNLPIYIGWDGWKINGKHVYKEVMFDNIALCYTPAWSDQNHIATKEYYETIVYPDCEKYGGPSNTWMEEVLNTYCLAYQERYGTYIYGNYGIAPVICHSDGREMAKK